jgi:hypothetical protein
LKRVGAAPFQLEGTFSYPFQLRTKALLPCAAPARSCNGTKREPHGVLFVSVEQLAGIVEVNHIDVTTESCRWPRGLRALRPIPKLQGAQNSFYDGAVVEAL